MSDSNLKKHLQSGGEEGGGVKQARASTYNNVKDYLFGDALGPSKFDPASAASILYKFPVVVPSSSNPSWELLFS